VSYFDHEIKTALTESWFILDDVLCREFLNSNATATASADRFIADGEQRTIQLGRVPTLATAWVCW